jgi:hypothetical protein
MSSYYIYIWGISEYASGGEQYILYCNINISSLKKLRQKLEMVFTFYCPPVFFRPARLASQNEDDVSQLYCCVE